MKRLTALALVTILTVACSGGPTSPSATTAAATSADHGFAAPNSAFPGTGTNDGLGSPNSCTDAKPAIIALDSNLEFIKIVASKVDGLTRGYQFRITRKDADKTPFSATFNTVGMDSAGREWQGNPTAFEPGQYLAEVRARRVGCASEFGAWSDAKEFHIAGDVINSPSRRRKYHKDPA
jgi:hypothetical protein